MRDAVASPSAWARRLAGGMLAAGLVAAGVAAVAALPGAARADATPVPAVRELRFAPGESRATVDGAVIRGERAYYRFRAKKGQPATLAVTALEGNAALEVYAPGARLPAEPDGDVRGTPLPGAGAGEDATGWSGTLPASGRYLVVVGPTRGNASYTLTLEIGR